MSGPRGEILRTARLLMRPGDVHEVRIPKAGRLGTISGYFDDPEKLATAVLVYDGTVPGVYATMNPCNPALLSRAVNRLKPWARETTSDTDIVRRRWLLLDFDPVRAAGISTTEAEHRRAFTVAYAAMDDLHGAGWPDPVVADSGNGAHLLYRRDLPNDAAATERVKRFLAGVAAQCRTDDIAVDQTVFNAARIVKLYGSMACKGDSTPDRPHRRSRMLDIPTHMEAL